MKQHPSRDRRLLTLRRNVLMYRALHMVLMLFYVEDLRCFVLGSLTATDFLAPTFSTRLPLRGTESERLKAAWQVLTVDGVLTAAEVDEIRELIDYRNHIAHRLPRMTADLSDFSNLWELGLFDSQALDRVARLRQAVLDGVQNRYVMELSFNGLMFESAEKTYHAELQRLKTRIDRQIATLRAAGYR